MSSPELLKVDMMQRDVIVRHTAQVPVKLGALAKELGVKVKLSSLDLGVSGKISKEGDSYVIRVNRFESKERQRFTLAHELAHFLLHKHLVDASETGITDNVLYRSGEPETVEFEANRLAADLVMPISVVETELDSIDVVDSDELVEYMANRFKVSKSAMEIRLGPKIN